MIISLLNSIRASKNIQTSHQIISLITKCNHRSSYAGYTLHTELSNSAYHVLGMTLPPVTKLHTMGNVALLITSTTRGINTYTKANL